MTTQQISDAIKNDANTHKPVMIAIEGFGGSGKSTLASELKTFLADAYVIGIDDFIIKEKLTDVSPDKIGFDRVRLERQVLIPATSGKSVSFERLEWADNKLSQPVRVPITKYLIIEGISSYHPDVAKYFDYKIWVNTLIEVATRRGRLKDAGNENEQHWDLWAKNDLDYKQKYQPEQRADFILDNTAEQTT